MRRPASRISGVRAFSEPLYNPRVGSVAEGALLTPLAAAPGYSLRLVDADRDGRDSRAGVGAIAVRLGFRAAASAPPLFPGSLRFHVGGLLRTLRFRGHRVSFRSQEMASGGPEALEIKIEFWKRLSKLQGSTQIRANLDLEFLQEMLPPKMRWV